MESMGGTVDGKKSFIYRIYYYTTITYRHCVSKVMHVLDHEQYMQGVNGVRLSSN